jgi:hypothetical protein
MLHCLLTSRTTSSQPMLRSARILGPLPPKPRLNSSRQPKTEDNLFRRTALLSLRARTSRLGHLAGLQSRWTLATTSSSKPTEASSNRAPGTAQGTSTATAACQWVTPRTSRGTWFPTRKSTRSGSSPTTDIIYIPSL